MCSALHAVSIVHRVGESLKHDQPCICVEMIRSFWLAFEQEELHKMWLCDCLCVTTVRATTRMLSVPLSLARSIHGVRARSCSHARFFISSTMPIVRPVCGGTHIAPPIRIHTSFSTGMRSDSRSGSFRFSAIHVHTLKQLALPLNRNTRWCMMTRPPTH